MNKVIGGFVQIIASWNVKAYTGAATKKTPDKLNRHQQDLLTSVIEVAKENQMENHLYCFLGCLGLTNLLRREEILPFRYYSEREW